MTYELHGQIGEIRKNAGDLELIEEKRQQFIEIGEAARQGVHPESVWVDGKPRGMRPRDHARRYGTTIDGLYVDKLIDPWADTVHDLAHFQETFVTEQVRVIRIRLSP